MFGRVRRVKSGWLAVGFYADRIDIAHVERPTGGRPRLTRLESYDRGQNDVAALTTLKRQKNLGGYRCTTLLNQGEYQLVGVDTPDVPDEELREAVRWRLKDVLEFPVDTATVDVVQLPVGQSAGRQAGLLAVAASNSTILSRMQSFSGARVTLGAIDIPEMAQRNLASLVEEENRGLAMLTFDAQGGILTFTFRGELCVSRRIEITSQQLAEGDEMRRAQLFERIGLELQRSMDNFERQYTTVSVSKIVLGPCPFAPGLFEHLRDYVYVPVTAFELPQLIDCQGIPELGQPASQAERLNLIGAALRDEPGNKVAA